MNVERRAYSIAQKTLFKLSFWSRRKNPVRTALYSGLCIHVIRYISGAALRKSFSDHHHIAEYQSAIRVYVQHLRTLPQAVQRHNMGTIGNCRRKVLSLSLSLSLALSLPPAPDMITGMVCVRCIVQSRRRQSVVTRKPLLTMRTVIFLRICRLSCLHTNVARSRGLPFAPFSKRFSYCTAGFPDTSAAPPQAEGGK